MRRRLIVLTSIGLMVLLGLALLKVADVALGAMALVKNPISPPATSEVRYKTSEFEMRVQVNRYGFRGTQETIRPGQVAVLGDSFTYGWGIDEKNTWAARLQDLLRASGRDLDVYNLGQPGTDTLAQLETAKTYVPLLKPSILVLSLVAGDDIADTMARDARVNPSSVSSRWRNGFKSVAEATFPNLFLTTFRLVRGVVDATASWPRTARSIVDEQGMHLDPEMMREVDAGNINPALLDLAARFPERNTRAYQDTPDAEKARAATIDAAEQLGRLVAANGGRLVVLSMPSAPFVRSAAALDHRRLGFRIPDADFVTRAPDEFASRLCERVRSDCVLLLDAMRERAKGGDVFFPLDGHINAAGSSLVAETLMRRLGRP